MYEAVDMDAVYKPEKREVWYGHVLSTSTEYVLHPEDSIYQWRSVVDGENTTIYANFQDKDPNREVVEINVRPACFASKRLGINYITIRGFEMAQAATQMSPPIHACLFEEIIPTLDLPKEELVSYANDVLTRFSNPYIKHYLASISLNSISKFKVRVLPSILEYKKRFGSYPTHLMYGFARLLEFYRIGTPNDDPGIIEFIRTHFIDEILANTDFWGQDLSDMKEVLSHAITSSR